MTRHRLSGHIFGFLCAVALAASSARAARADLPDMPDPVHVSLDKTDPPPMDDMRQLALQGDARAMFILGDMYEKEKGGLRKNWPKARKWFEDAGRHGLNYAFIRLAAMAKHDRQPKEAWQWYTLAIEGFSDDSDDDGASATLGYVIQARQDLVKSAKLSEQDIAAARASMAAWKSVRDKASSGEKSTATASLQPQNNLKLNQ
ncbi:MAG: hypothetical protein KGQ70_06385 [Alphaproteobacteria bacterium]|nr:hypothetical protein [Alphaproteobacteria bacterium]